MIYRRTLVALILTVIAVSVPSVAWFVGGRRQVEREVRAAEKAVYLKAHKKVVMLAGRLTTRLEVLREGESRRPFYHYQNLFHDPYAAAEGASVSISPLAHGPADPMIEAYFQVDQDGRLTLPTLNDEFPELGLSSTDSAHCALLEDLGDVVFFCLEHTLDGPADGTATAGMTGAGNGQARTEVLEMSAWRQHLQANALYGDLKYSQGKGDLRLATTDEAPVRIEVEPLTWHTLPVGEKPALVALRSVRTPVGEWRQGFVISDTGVREELEHADYPAVFAPAADLDDLPGTVTTPVEGTPWAVQLLVADRLDDLQLEQSAEEERFFGLFVLGMAGAGLAALFVVLMVYQSERLALQRSQFAASAAHELRTPLAGLQLYGEMLAEGLGDPAKARRYARRVADEAARLARVVSNVLSFTRLERQSLAVRPESGDLTAAVQSAVDRQLRTLEEAGIGVEVELSEVAARFDSDAVDHIVQNLLDNAEKYTRGIDGRRVRVTLLSGEGGAVLSVADNGQGIPPSERRRLFRPFARGLRTDAAEGLGLGLVLVKVLVQAQGGDIRYCDGPAGGADFRVTFPS